VGGVALLDLDCRRRRALKTNVTVPDGS